MTGRNHNVLPVGVRYLRNQGRLIKKVAGVKLIQDSIPYKHNRNPRACALQARKYLLPHFITCVSPALPHFNIFEMRVPLKVIGGVFAFFINEIELCLFQ